MTTEPLMTTDLMTNEPWKNWAGNVTFTAAPFFRR